MSPDVKSGLLAPRSQAYCIAWMMVVSFIKSRNGRLGMNTTNHSSSLFTLIGRICGEARRARRLARVSMFALILSAALSTVANAVAYTPDTPLLTAIPNCVRSALFTR